MEPRAKILIVDDEAGIRFFLDELLTGDGYQVVAVESGKQAIERVAAEEFDLALVDLRLQDTDGIEVLTEIRRHSPDTVVIMLTAHASLQTAVEALRQGAHDYLFKPTKTVELRESIRRGLLDRQQKARQRDMLQQLEHHLSSSLQDLRATIVDKPTPTDTSSVVEQLDAPLPDDQVAQEQARFLQRGGLIIDFMRHIITLDGHLLELSPTEFDLLAYLIGEAPRVVAPQELVREVQGYNSDQWEASETVRYHIYRIRQKIKSATGRTKVVRTVRGVGYTIDEM
jgi:DNA-binding response OmpR family regulator